MRMAYRIALPLLGFAAFAQVDPAKVEIKVQKVAGNVYMLQGAGGNIGVSVGQDGILIVDDQYAPLAPKIKEALRGISDKPVKFVLNTHYHADHTGGNEAFGESAPIIAHTNVRKRLAEGVDVPGWKIPPAPKVALPVITFDDRVAVHINGEDIRAIHFPKGHTDGDSIIYFTRSNVVHMGDDFFAGRFPFIDLDSGGDVRGFIRNVEKVLQELPADAKIIPGHGPLCTPVELRNYLAMLKETAAIVENAIKAGKTVEQAKEEKLLAKYDSYAWQFITADRYLETLFRGLK